MPTDQHLDTVGLLKAKVEGEIARLEPSIADRENYDDTRVRLHVKAEALRWVLREIEALPPVGEAHGPSNQHDNCPVCAAIEDADKIAHGLPPISPLGAEDLERAAREHWDARRPTYSHHWGQLTAAEKSYECDLMRAALLALGLPVEPGQ